MGKKKTQSQRPNVPVTEKCVKQKVDKGKKTYLLPTTKVDDGSKDQKIRIPQDLEREIVSLIQDDYKQEKIIKDLSKRLTAKKLTDMYTSLSQAGFSHAHIEQTLSNTVLHGGDLIDALDWLCLNLANDQLPQGFSDTLEKEENKIRPKFDHHVIDQEMPTSSSVTKGTPDEMPDVV